MSSSAAASFLAFSRLSSTHYRRVLQSAHTNESIIAKRGTDNTVSAYLLPLWSNINPHPLDSTATAGRLQVCGLGLVEEDHAVGVVEERARAGIDIGGSELSHLWKKC